MREVGFASSRWALIGWELTAGQSQPIDRRICLGGRLKVVAAFAPTPRFLWSFALLRGSSVRLLRTKLIFVVADEVEEILPGPGSFGGLVPGTAVFFNSQGKRGGTQRTKIRRVFSTHL